MPWQGNLGRKTLWLWLGIIVLVSGSILAYSRHNGETPYQQSSPSPFYPELKDLFGKELPFPELVSHFRNIAQKKGAGYALDVLKVAPLPSGIDLHLLAHTVGDILYRQQGLEGITICTEDFRNACSHSIVIGAFNERGADALADIAQACRQAPGGRGAYTMCFHGLGHGILAWASYDLSKAVEICQKTGTPEYKHQEAHQCVSGAIMEIIGGGFHDPKTWAKERPKYISADDPLAPCNRDLIPNDSKYLCFVYLTPHLFEATGADLARPTAENFKRAFPLCNKIPPSDAAHRDACYGGFGKEFVVLAQSRDVRKIEAMTDTQLKQVYEWCLLSDNREGSAACIAHAMQSLYWGGENNRTIAVRFCTLIYDEYHRTSCFMGLIGAVAYYIQDPQYRTEFCHELPVNYQGACRERLGS